MSATTKAPIVSIDKFKRTKIIATVGPSTDTYESILKLIKAGANGLRLNFSHGDHAEHGQRITWIRKASKEYGKPVTILQDLQGPKIRLGDFEGIITVQKGQSLRFQYNADYEKDGKIPTQYDLSKKVKRGEQILLYDGKVRTTVTSVSGDVVHVRAENSGILIKRKGMNLPDTDFAGDIITEKDKKDIVYGASQDIDWVALSFVQSAGDVSHLRKLLRNLGSNAKIMAKIETKSAVDNLEDIVQEADGVMVARGDLATETTPESVPILQREIIGLGHLYAKPTVVATQMLASMTETPEPTRAEVSDVATAVIVGSDAVMLSDETASGDYPIESVEVMKRIILYTEMNASIRAVFTDHKRAYSRQDAICNAVIGLADSIDAKAIVAETKSGSTALQIASRRPDRPILAVTSEARTAQQLAICFGTKSYVRPDSKYAASTLTDWLVKNNVLHKGDVVVTASGKYPGVVGTTDTIKVRMLE